MTQLTLRDRLLWWTVVRAERIAQWCRLRLFPRRGAPSMQIARACVDGLHGRCSGAGCGCICHEAPRP